MQISERMKYFLSYYCEITVLSIRFEIALAFTIALHRVSGHDCLLFIDTPVGRVSDINREKFAQSLVEVSKQKQLILAFTPSEYSEEIRRYFDEDVMSSFSRMSSNEEIVTLKEG